MIKYSDQHQLTTMHDSQPFNEDQNTLFVGCLDPKTCQTDLEVYFRQYDSCLHAKLIFNLETGKSKQCGLLFCSNDYVCKLILSSQHILHGRHVRIEKAQDNRQGSKTSSSFLIQVSGLSPSTTLDHLGVVFSEWPGLIRMRFIQGIHPKQKKVALIAFESFESFKSILTYSHVKIDGKNCKIAEYIPKSEKVQLQDAIPLQGKPLLSNFISPQQVHRTPLQHSPTFHPASSSPSAPIRGNRPHKVPIFDYNQTSYLHPVEMEKDALFRIFCSDPKEGEKLRRA